MVAGLLLAMTSQAQQNDRIPAKGFAFHAEDGHFHDYSFTRRAVGDNDVQIKILYAGICHSDLHEADGIKARNGVPVVLGHEIAGEVIAVGRNVTKFKIGDYAGVGCMVDACGHCTYCDMDKEQFCENGTTFTYAIPTSIMVENFRRADIPTISWLASILLFPSPRTPTSNVLPRCSVQVSRRSLPFN